MSLIFDRFPEMEKARQFAIAVKARFDLDCQVFDDERKAFAHDYFPWRLDAPIVHVDRPWCKDQLAIEDAVEKSVKEFGGTFAGT